jgi:hypothetical protein
MIRGSRIDLSGHNWRTEFDAAVDYDFNASTFASVSTISIVLAISISLGHTLIVITLHLCDHSHDTTLRPISIRPVRHIARNHRQLCGKVLRCFIEIRRKSIANLSFDVDHIMVSKNNTL